MSNMQPDEEVKVISVSFTQEERKLFASQLENLENVSVRNEGELSIFELEIPSEAIEPMLDFIENVLLQDVEWWSTGLTMARMLRR